MPDQQTTPPKQCFVACPPETRCECREWHTAQQTTPPDIVARLRAVDHMDPTDCFLQSPLLAKAADEIERLRAEAEKWKALATIYAEDASA